MARHFQYKVEVFFREIILGGPLGKTKYYAICTEFQERGSPHVHSYMERPGATFCNGKYSVLNDFVMQNFSHITHLKINQIRPVNISQIN